MNNKIRRELIIEQLRDARAPLELGRLPRRRQAERHVRYWSDQLNQGSETQAATDPAESTAPAT